MSGVPVKALVNVSWGTPLLATAGFGHLKVTVRWDLVAGIEIRSCQYEERLDALHTEIRMAGPACGTPVPLVSFWPLRRPGLWSGHLADIDDELLPVRRGRW